MNLPQQNIVTTTKTNLMQTVSVANNSTMPLSNAMDPLLELYEDLQQSKQVRMGIDDDEKPFVSVFDFINFVAGKSMTNSYGQKTHDRYTSIDSKYFDELAKLTFMHKFTNRETPCVNITGIFFLYIFIFHAFYFCSNFPRDRDFFRT